MSQHVSRQANQPMLAHLISNYGEMHTLSCLVGIRACMQPLHAAHAPT